MRNFLTLIFFVAVHSMIFLMAAYAETQSGDYCVWQMKEDGSVYQVCAAKA